MLYLPKCHLSVLRGGGGGEEEITSIKIGAGFPWPKIQKFRRVVSDDDFLKGAIQHKFLTIPRVYLARLSFRIVSEIL